MSLFQSSLKSHQGDFITAKSVKSMLKHQGFNVRSQKTIRHEIARLDREVADVIYDDKAYYANRQACWNLTSLLLKEVR